MVTNMKLDKSCETNINQGRQSRELASGLLVYITVSKKLNTHKCGAVQTQ